MAELVNQGLEISVLGMGLTFAALGLLILLMVLLERLFRPKPAAAVEPPLLTDPVAAQTEEEEIAAAIGIALIYLQTQANERAALGSRLEAGRGAWWSGVRASSRRRLG